MEITNCVKLQEELSSAMKQLSALKVLLQQKDSLLRESYTNYSKLQEKSTHLTENNKRLQLRISQINQENSQKPNMGQLDQNNLLEQYLKLQNEALAEQLSNLKQKMTQFQTKNNPLSQELAIQKKLTTEHIKKYNQKCQELSHATKILTQVQQEVENAKKFRDKTFEEEYNKLLKQSKKIQAKAREIKEDNQNLKYQAMIYQEKIQSLKNTLAQNICTISQHIQIETLLQTTINELKQTKKRQRNLIHERMALQTRISLKDQEISSLHLQLYDLQQSPIDQQTTINPKPPANYPKTTNKSTEDQFFYQQIPQFKPILQNPLPNPIDYVSRIAVHLDVSWTDIYIEIDGCYILNHSNIPLDIDEFLVYDWSKLKQARFYKTGFDVEKWKKLVDNAKKFPCLETIYLYGNPLTLIKSQDLSNFKKLKQVVFRYSDQTRGYRTNGYPVYSQMGQ